jgi:DNA polymerase phi
MQSGVLLEPECLDGWNELLNRVYGMACDVPWLREECGLILVEAVSSLGAEAGLESYAQELVQRLVSTSLANTPEGVAVWLALRMNHETILPAKIWHNNDPLAKKERARLAKILKEDFRTSPKDGKTEDIKSAAASHNPSFAWDLLISKVLEMDKAKGDRTDPDKSEFAQFWLDTVDGMSACVLLRPLLTLFSTLVWVDFFSRTQILGLQAFRKNDTSSPESARLGDFCIVQSEPYADIAQSDQEG